MSEQLTVYNYDANGERPNAGIIGMGLRHTGTGKTYYVVDFVWLGESDQWGYLHRAEGEALIARPLAHLTGRRANGDIRYEVVLGATK